MKVYLVWYYNYEAFGHTASLYGIYSTKEKAEEALADSGFSGWVNEENVG